MGSVINGVKTRSVAYQISKQYFFYAVICILIWAPVAHFFTVESHILDVKESLAHEFLIFEQQMLPLLDTSNIVEFNSYNSDVRIEPDKNLTKQEFRIVSDFKEIDNSESHFRELRCPILINGLPFTYCVRRRDGNSKTFILNTIILVCSISITLIIGLIIISVRTSKRLMRDLNTSLDLVDKFKMEKLPDFPKTTVEEFARFTHILRNRMSKNMNIYLAQKEFVENAAHELQTPLSIFQAQVELLAQDSYINEKRSEVLTSIQKSISRMNRLNRNLLLLSKMEHKGYEKLQDVSINKIIEEHLDFFKEQSLKKNITITIDFESQLLVNSNVILAEVFVRNLFMNSIRHNIKDGIIDVKVKSNSFIFSNTGVNESLNKEFMWNRFHKINSSEGTGLGLSIIKRIADINDWSITYSYSQGLHTFEIVIRK